jgi:hypothetical protein
MQPITVRQKSTVLLLMRHSCFSDEERAAMREKLAAYSTETARQVIKKLVAKMSERGVAMDRRYIHFD